jgi:hypothetical protein
MALPSHECIRTQLVLLLLSEPEQQLHCRDVYPKLAKQFPALTAQEVSVRYRHSASLWANRVQCVKQDLTTDGWLLRPSQVKRHGIWKVSRALVEHEALAVTLAGRKLKTDLSNPGAAP